MKVITNHHPRNMKYGYELPKKEQAYFLDYINEENFPLHDFVYYKGSYYDFSDFEWVTTDRPELFAQGWQGIIADSMFSGIVIKFPDEHNMDQVIVGMVLS